MTEPRKRTSVSIDAALAETIREKAAERLIGPGLLAEHLLRDGLSRLAPPAVALTGSEPAAPAAGEGDEPTT